MNALTALLRAHCAAAQTWRLYVGLAAETSDLQPARAQWLEAERELTRVLEGGR